MAAAQQSTPITSFEMGSAEPEVVRLQAVYTAKRAELEAFERLFAETEPDIVRRGPAGQKLIVIGIGKQSLDLLFTGRAGR